MTDTCPDGVTALPPIELMDPMARRMRAIYAMTPGEPLFQREFGFMEGVRERWIDEGLDPQADWAAEFGFDAPGIFGLGGLGWCEAAFCPDFEVKVIEDRGEHELYQDHAGRGVLVFKGRRQGFMPEYVDHPVKNLATWRDMCAWRMDPEAPGRFDGTEKLLADARRAAARGMMISQRCIGPYMYLRSLIGPAELLYGFYDQPELIHECMRAWFDLADAVIARHQRDVTLDELFFAEDICYNHGPLISPEMMGEFILPYYRRLIDRARARQIDADRTLHIQIDTDGLALPVVDLYREAVGMTVMSPFEVASGCDVLEVAERWPELVITGGIDKRVLAAGKKEIDRMLERILPPMRRRGGYIPTCDHAVPLEVPLENYRHYRRRCLELGAS